MTETRHPAGRARATRFPRRTPLAVAAGIAIAAAGFSFSPASAKATAGATQGADSSRPVSSRNHVRAGVMPKVPPGPRTAAAPSGAHLTYYGGKVISNVQVIQVLYGSGTYTSEVQNT